LVKNNRSILIDPAEKRKIQTSKQKDSEWLILFHAQMDVEYQ